MRALLALKQEPECRAFATSDACAAARTAEAESWHEALVDLWLPLLVLAIGVGFSCAALYVALHEIGCG